MTDERFPRCTEPGCQLLMFHTGDHDLGVRGLTDNHVRAIAKAVYDHSSPGAPVEPAIRNFCRYLIEDYTGE